MRMPAADPLEDALEALRLILTILEPDGLHTLSERDWAAVTVAADALRLDPPAPWPHDMPGAAAWRENRQPKP